MPFVTMTKPNVGDAVVKELFDDTIDNLDFLNSEVNNLSNASKRIIVFDETIINAASATSLTGINYFQAIQPFTLTNCFIRIFEKGSLTGTLEVNVLRNTTFDNVGMTSVFTTRPSINVGTASNYQQSTNAVFSGSQILIPANEILRLDITSMPTNGILGRFRIILFGEVTT